MTTDHGYPHASTISDEELDVMVSEESEAQQPADDPLSEPTTGIDAQIEAAEKSGNWLRAGTLKVEKTRVQQSADQPQETLEDPSIQNLIAQIHDAETNRDFYASGLAKFKLMNKTAAMNQPDGGDIAPTPSSDQDQHLKRRIHDAESQGEYAESLRLKSLRAGITP